MKQQAVNTFEGGMVTDIDELGVNPNSLTYAKNIEFITTKGNQLVLQKRQGRKASINITAGYNIKAVKVINDIAYIVSARTARELEGQILTTHSDLETQNLNVTNVTYSGLTYNVSIFDNLNIDEVEVLMKRPASVLSGEIRYLLYGIDPATGYPEASPLSSTDYVPYSDIDTEYKYLKIGFTSPVDVTAYKEIAVVIDNNTSGTISALRSDADTTYPDGGSIFKDKVSGSWVGINQVGPFSSNLYGSYTTQGESELGTYPSPDYPAEGVTEDTIVDLINEYRPLQNFRAVASDNDSDYNDPFRTALLDILPDSSVNLELQKTYDGSINMIFSSTGSVVRLVNTKFKANGDGTATLIKRRLDKNDNVYSEDEFQKTELIPRPIVVGNISSIEILNNGSLPAGGYRYYIKYVTADGVETDVIEESRTIDIHYGNSVLSTTGGAQGEIINKSVVLYLENMDTAFKGIKLYFSVSAGDTAVATELFKISNTFDIDGSGLVKVIHSGYEDTTSATQDELNLNYSQIKNSTLITKVNNRLALSGHTTSLNHRDEYAELATRAMPKSVIDSVTGVHSPVYPGTDYETNTHANPERFYDMGEYWDGETYEIGIVFITEKGITPVYPTQGIDETRSLSYDKGILGNTSNGFDPETGQNPKGVFRTRNVNHFWRRVSNDLRYETLHIRIDLSWMTVFLSSFPEILGYYFVRKERKKDVLMRGMLFPTVAIPNTTTFGAESESNMGFWSIGARPRIDRILDGGHKWVPAPDLIMPYGLDRINNKPGTNDGRRDRLGDIQLRSCSVPSGIDTSTDNAYFGFYSPDIDCNTAYNAALLTNRKFGIYTYKLEGMQSTALIDQVGGSFNETGLYVHNYWNYPDQYSAGSILEELRRVGSLTFVDEGVVGAGSNSFAGSTDRNVWCNIHENTWLTYQVTHEAVKAYASVWTLDDFYGYPLGADTGTRGGNALKYGRYAGIRFNPGEAVSQNSFRDMFMSFWTNVPGGGSLNLNYWYSAVVSIIAPNAPVASPGSDNFHANKVTGYMAVVYASTNTNHLSASEWESKYSTDDNGKFFTITRRYDAGNTSSPYLGDGDCYSGTAWKRVYRPRGIDEAPQATDVEAYSEDRRNIGLCDFGYAVSYPTKSNFNFHLRVPSNKNDSEFDLFGQKRSFLPVEGVQAIRGAKLDETDKFNFGYGAAQESMVSQFKLDPDAPYYKVEHPNRIYVSDIDIESNFTNGFTQFKGLSYKDYESEFGPIRAMVTANGRIFLTFDSGVITVGVDERSMLPGSEGNIFMDSADALAPKSEVKSTIVGSDQPKSVIATSNVVYGVDTDKYKVWRTDGTKFEVISDLLVQSWLQDTITTFKSSLNKDYKFVVYTTYDSKKSELLFTFTSIERQSGEVVDSKTISYNETLKVWICDTDEHCSSIFYIDDSKYAARPNFESSIYLYGGNALSNELNTTIVEPTILEFVLNKEQGISKVLENIIVVGNSAVPKTLTYTTDGYGNRDGTPALTQDVISKTSVSFLLRSAIEATKYGEYGLEFSSLNFNTIVNPITGLQLSDNELVTLITKEGVAIKTKIVRISEDGTIVHFADSLLNSSSYDLYYGHKESIRRFNTEVNEGITYISPLCNTDSNVILPRGKWIKIRMLFTAADQIYVTGIASVYNQSLT
jgi:hypothetical protein